MSDIKSIADIAHSHNAVVIVDEAHGAHMRFSPIFPESAIECGADIVVHGIHKTLPALTQTALLHVVTERVDASEIKRSLAIFQSSSPSYILMGATDYCMDMLDKSADSLFTAYSDRLTALYDKLSCLKSLEVLPYGNTRDASKIVISTLRCDLDGLNLYRLLREKYMLQPEMSLPQYVIMMTSIGDTQNNLDLLTDAIIEIDNESSGEAAQESVLMDEQPLISYIPENNAIYSRHIKPGDTADDTLYVYPPGIPLIATGEIYTEDIINKLNDYYSKGYKIKGNKGL